MTRGQRRKPGPRVDQGIAEYWPDPGDWDRPLDPPKYQAEIRRLIELNGPYDWFVTLTFGWDTTGVRAHGIWKRWIRDVSAALGALTGQEPNTRWFVVLESNREGGHLHVHAAIKAKGLDQLSVGRWTRHWVELGGGQQSKVAQKPKTDRVKFYLTKQIKTGTAFYDAGGHIQGWELS